MNVSSYKYRYKIRRLIVLMNISFITALLFAQQVEERRFSKEYVILYKIEKSNIDTTFYDNKTELYRLDSDIKKILSLKDVSLDSLVVISSASPDGDSLYNFRLSERRGQSIDRFISTQNPDFDKNILFKFPVGENWEAFRDIALTDVQMPMRNELIEIIDNGSMTVAAKEKWLRNNRTLYRYVMRNHIHKLRSAYVHLNYTCRYMAFPSLSEGGLAVDMDRPQHIYVPQPETPERKFSLPPFGIKTNTLYDVALVPNIGVEFFFNRRWSVSANWMFAWWKSDKRSWYWRVYGGELEGRWWFGKNGYGDNFTGHHLGLYAQAGTFDFEAGGGGQMVDKWSFGGGVSYGYSLPLTKRLNMDFSIGLGYFRADFKEYLPIGGHYVWQQTTRRNWIGPTKAEVSLVWIIGGNKR